jgi:hypothetical protein
MLKFLLFGSLAKKIFLEGEGFSTLHSKPSARKGKKHGPALEGFLVYIVGEL